MDRRLPNGRRIWTATSLRGVCGALVACSLAMSTAGAGDHAVGTKLSASGEVRPKTGPAPDPHPDQKASQGQAGLTLARCIAIARGNSPRTARKEWDAKAAHAEKDTAQGRLWPEIRAVGGYSHSLEDRLISPRRSGSASVLGFTDDLLRGSVVLNMPLYTGGRLRNQVNAADFLARAADQRLLHSREELVFNVSSVFYSILGQREVINALAFSRKTLEQHQKRTVELIEAKKAARVDSLRTEVRLADIEQQLLREENTLAVQRFLLASLMGLDQSKQSPRIEGDLRLVNTPVELGPGLATALARRQDYQALTSSVSAQHEKLEVAKAGHRPQISLTASYGNQWAMDRSDSNEVGEIGFLVDIPLFDGGRIGASIRREHSRLRATEEAARELELRIQLEVKTASANVRSTLARISVTEKAVGQADESLRIERERYDLGKGTIMDVLDAQSALLASQTNYYRALADYNTALAQFRLATGSEQ
jgi:outer membrane protein